VSFAAITLCFASQRVFIVVYFVIDSIRKLLDTPSYSYGDEIGTRSDTECFVDTFSRSSDHSSRLEI
jgi:hypothetical protein